MKKMRLEIHVLCASRIKPRIRNAFEILCTSKKKWKHEDRSTDEGLTNIRRAHVSNIGRHGLFM
jgi:hypothetical protein